ncbi:MAG: ABC transporter permease [Thermoplasmata archaeon]|nr:ABC transporter permease [Thermoplasmata archaeon]
MRFLASRRRGRLRHERLQTVLAVLAIGTAVALPVVLLSVGGGVSQHELAALRDAGYSIVVSASGVHGITQAHTLGERIESISRVSAASPVLSQAVDLFTRTSGPTPVLAEGVVPQAFAATAGPTERGLISFPLPLGDPNDLVHFANGTYRGPETYSVLISTPFAEGSGLVVGDTVGLSPSANSSDQVRFNITGIFGIPPSSFGPPSSFAILLPLSDLQVLTGWALQGNSGGSLLDAADTIQVAMTGAASTDPTAIRETASAIQSLVPYYGVSALLDEAQQLQSGTAVLTGFYLALSSVGLAIGLIFLALILLRRVERLRQSIGIRRAIGVPPRMIAGEMVLTGAVLSAAGGLVGVVAGFLLVLALKTWGSQVVQTAVGYAVFDPLTLAALTISVVLLSLAASLLATRAALRLSIPEALR